MDSVVKTLLNSEKGYQNWFSWNDSCTCCTPNNICWGLQHTKKCTKCVDRNVSLHHFENHRISDFLTYWKQFLIVALISFIRNIFGPIYTEITVQDKIDNETMMSKIDKNYSWICAEVWRKMIIEANQRTSFLWNTNEVLKYASLQLLI